MTVDDLRTRVASQAASLSEAVGDGFRTFRIGQGDYGVELQVPQGPSTGGGIQARQNLCLAPRKPGFPVVVAGHVDTVAKNAELRGLAYVSAVQQARFGSPLAISPEEYATFLKLAVALLQLAGIRATVVNAPPSDLRSVPPPGTGRKKGGSVLLLGLAFVVVALVSFAVGYRVLGR